MNDDYALARRYISSHIQLRRMFRHHSEEPDGPVKQIEYDESALNRELDELEAELNNVRD
jgi:hypothetical protein